jgi:hypothetical protein
MPQENQDKKEKSKLHQFSNIQFSHHPAQSTEKEPSNKYLITGPKLKKLTQAKKPSSDSLFLPEALQPTPKPKSPPSPTPNFSRFHTTCPNSNKPCNPVAWLDLSEVFFKTSKATILKKPTTIVSNLTKDKLLTQNLKNLWSSNTK